MIDSCFENIFAITPIQTNRLVFFVILISNFFFSFLNKKFTFTLGVYLTVVMGIASISIVMTVVVLNFHYCSPINKHELPAWIKSLIINDEKNIYNDYYAARSSMSMSMTTNSNDLQNCDNDKNDHNDDDGNDDDNNNYCPIMMMTTKSTTINEPDIDDGLLNHKKNPSKIYPMDQSSSSSLLLQNKLQPSHHYRYKKQQQYLVRICFQHFKTI